MLTHLLGNLVHTITANITQTSHKRPTAWVTVLLTSDISQNCWYGGLHLDTVTTPITNHTTNSIYFLTWWLNISEPNWWLRDCVRSFIQIFFWDPIQILSSLYLYMLCIMSSHLRSDWLTLCFIWTKPGTQVKLFNLHKLAWISRSHCLSSGRQSLQIACWYHPRASQSTRWEPKQNRDDGMTCDLSLCVSPTATCEGCWCW